MYFRNSSLVICTALLLFPGTTLLAADAGQAEKKAFISFSLNAVPSLQNDDISGNPGYKNLNDNAYQFQGNLVWGPNTQVLGSTEYSYLSVRRGRWVENWDDGSYRGASEIEGTGLLYGQRYMLRNDRYEGFGLGWYAGVWMSTDRYVERSVSGAYVNTTPQKESGMIPIIAGELFYKWNITRMLFVEPGAILGANKDTGGFRLLGQIMVGVEF